MKSWLWVVGMILALLAYGFATTAVEYNRAKLLIGPLEPSVVAVYDNQIGVGLLLGVICAVLSLASFYFAGRDS